jgi:hypothetical protein
MTQLNLGTRSLLKPVRPTSENSEDRIYTLTPLDSGRLKARSKHVQYYKFEETEEQSFKSLEQNTGVLSAMSPLECFNELCTRFPPANPGCRRVFLIRTPWFRIGNSNKENSDLSNERVRIESSGMPYSSQVVVFPDDIYEGNDLIEFRDLIVRCGSFPTINDEILRHNQDTNLMWSKGLYSPGALKIALYDHDGRIAKRRNTLKTKKNGVTLELYSNFNELQNAVRELSRLTREECKRISNIHSIRAKKNLFFAQKNPFFKADYSDRTCDLIFLRSSYGSSALPAWEHIQKEMPINRGFHVGDHLANLSLMDCFLDGILINVMRRSSVWPQFRRSFLTALLHLTEPLATVRYLCSEVAPPGSSGLTSVMDSCFAVARLIRTLSPTRQEILDVRSKHAEPDPELTDAACDYLRRTGCLLE